jgi:hypothetical protein
VEEFRSGTRRFMDVSGSGFVGDFVRQIFDCQLRLNPSSLAKYEKLEIRCAA